MLSYNLVGGWRLDDPLGSVRADVLGSTPLGEAGGTLPNLPGKIGQCVGFTNNGRILVSTTTLVPGGSFSMSCWVNWTSGGTTTATVFSQLATTPRHLLGMNATSRLPRYSVGSVFTEGVPLVPGRWTHLALSYDDAAQSFTSYQDGVPIAVHTGAANFAAMTGMSMGNSLSALVDEAYIWNRALTSAEIAQVFAAGNAGLSYPFTDGKGFG